MINIHKSPEADSRTANEPLTPVKLRSSTVSHMKDVDAGLNFLAYQLKEKGKHHDHTKIEYLDDFFQALTSGKVKESDWYKLHITEERHHLKSNVPNDVNLLDVIEHLVDCTMAGLARSGEIYDIDLSPEVLQLAAQNTVELIKNNVRIVSDEGNLLDEEIKEEK